MPDWPLPCSNFGGQRDPRVFLNNVPSEQKPIINEKFLFSFFEF